MKKGTILKNIWARHETYFVYMGFPARTGKREAKATGGYALVKLSDGWKFERAEYYIHDLKDTEHFPVVGYVDINRAMADVILQAISMGAEPPKEGSMNHCENCKFLKDVFGNFVRCVKTGRFVDYEYWNDVEVEDCPLKDEPPKEEA